MSQFLFRLSVAFSMGLMLTVLLAPCIDTGGAPATGWPHLIALFARDATLRRTTLASSFGLMVSACVFFRPPGGKRVGVAPRKRTGAGQVTDVPRSVGA